LVELIDDTIPPTRDQRDKERATEVVDAEADDAEADQPDRQLAHRVRDELQRDPADDVGTVAGKLDVPVQGGERHRHRQTRECNTQREYDEIALHAHPNPEPLPHLCSSSELYVRCTPASSW